nr:response regulator [Desulfobacula sp.]
MEPGYQHKALVADDDEMVARTIARVLQHEDIVFMFTDSGESALEHIRNSKTPFSIIIADTDLKGIRGEKLLEHAKISCRKAAASLWEPIRNSPPSLMPSTRI